MPRYGFHVSAESFLIQGLLIGVSCFSRELPHSGAPEVGNLTSIRVRAFPNLNAFGIRDIPRLAGGESSRAITYLKRRFLDEIEGSQQLELHKIFVHPTVALL